MDIFLRDLSCDMAFVKDKNIEECQMGKGEKSRDCCLLLELTTELLRWEKEKQIILLQICLR